MEKDYLRRLKEDLKIAVKNQDYERINEIKNILNVSEKQEKYFSKGLTGYPSIDEIWLKYYKNGAEEMANNIPVDKTVWDVIEEKLLEYYDIPALEYFGKEFSRQEFIDLCYTWARTFRAMGVEENEVVPVYGPFVPDICAMVFALNMIGACPYFLKLAIDEKSLSEETQDSKIAVVYDGMWGNVAKEFSKDKFKNVIVASVSADMPSPKKQIVSFMSKIQAIKDKSQIPNEKKYIWADKAKDIANYYSGEVKVPFREERSTFITSSSGTTIGGIVKGTVATNETTISQLYMAEASDVLYFPGEKCLNHFPPTASTSLNILFLLPLFKGLKIYVDPRVSEKDFYRQLTTIKPHLAVNTGSMWESFFNRLEKDLNEGKKFDFSHVRGWVVGGEGTDVKKFLHWKDLMKKTGSLDGLGSAYGTSELFSAACTEKDDARCDFSKTIMSVGIPYAGTRVGAFDSEGNELTYNERGNLWIKSNSVMKGYYGKPELTKSIIEDGWVKTGDMGEIDDNGFVYVWGRISDKINVDNKTTLYLFDVAEQIKKHSFIEDAIVISKPTVDNPYNLVAHIVWNKENLKSEKESFEILNKDLLEFLPNEVKVSGYAIHDEMLPYSPTTLKKDKNAMSKQNDNYYQIIEGKLNKIEFIPNNYGKYETKCDIILEDTKNKQKVLKR